MGKVEITESGDQFTIALNAVHAAIIAGGNGLPGRFFLKSDAGAEMIRMGPPVHEPGGGTIDLHNAQGGNTIHLGGGSGEIVTGGNGQTGAVIVKSNVGKQIVRIDSAGGTLTQVTGGRISLFDAEGTSSIRLGGNDASIRAGAQGHDGSLVLENRQSLQRVRIDAAGGSNVLLFGTAATEQDTQDPNRATIRLDGQNAHVLIGGVFESGKLSLRNVEGTRYIHMEAVAEGAVREATMYLGGNGMPGRLRIYGHAPGAPNILNYTIYMDGESGDITLRNADCAEEFDIVNPETAEPGTVMVLTEDGKLQPSTDAYDRKVAGVISGGGDFKPGIILDKRPSSAHRLPVALMGKAYCKVDARYGAIEIGDLLTTSPTAGHAMKVQHVHRAFGAVIGKALRPLAAEQGLIPILIALQ
jgi:hypothetical protein